MRLDLGHHFHIVEIGEDELPPAGKKMEAEPAPKIDQAFLRMDKMLPILTALCGAADNSATGLSA